MIHGEDYKGRISLAMMLAAALFVAAVPARAQKPRYVVLIGCDGMSPDGVRKANTPALDRMMREGSYTLHARGVMPTMSAPNWASMLNGAGPEEHGVLNNDWKPGRSSLSPTAESKPGMFPTIFSVLRKQHPQARIACFHDWSGISVLIETEAADIIEDTKGVQETAERAIWHIQKDMPTFTFIHFDKIDKIGHEIGHGSKEYYRAVEEVDLLIGKVLRAIENAGVLDQTTIIVSSDHGGRGKGHGRPTMAEIEIPWIIMGPGVRVGHEISSPVSICDTAATIAYALDIEPHPAWIGRPVADAYSKQAEVTP